MATKRKPAKRQYKPRRKIKPTLADAVPVAVPIFIEPPKPNPVGRPSEYGPHVLEITKWYFAKGFKERGQPIPTKAGLGIELGGISQQTIANWAAKNPEFVEALGAGLNYTELELLDGGLNGRFNPTFASLVAANTIRYRSKSDVDHQSSDGSMTPKAPIDDTARIEAITRLLRPSN